MGIDSFLAQHILYRDSPLDHQVNLTLDAEEVRTIPSEFEFVPTPGDLRTLIFSKAYIIFDSTAGALGNVDPTVTLGIVYSGSYRASLTTDPASTFFDGAVFRITVLTPYILNDGAFPDIYADSQDIGGQNKGFSLKAENTGDFTGGDTLLYCSTLFNVWDFAQKKFLSVVESGWNPISRTFNN